ncbi:diguanylate cyclase [Rhodoferax saidenbachensis]|uniref:diguanylate cyclase n=1 Tax=Rhodoferax saidenbachensis TaxID=1484693 RepID=A0A1P8KEH6_9BURK|nr:diguanylate cyclase [Rhodoferax saidenbachensis]APW44437.1 diguanylate cyclase response regulator [Rhodoferax saidenbachensis]
MTDSETSVSALLDSTHGKPKLLVVDDQPINVQVMYQAFAGDYQVFMATSGEQALAICESNPPDLVLLDVVMPGMDGFAVCEKLKSTDATRHIPVIFVTAHNDPAQETHGLSLGAVDFIAKPVNPAVVRARVKTHLTLKFQSDLLRRLVFLDGLTGVFNRRYFDQQFPIEWARSMRNGSPLSLLLVDVDFFKRYNDRYGHQAGDDALRLVGATLKSGLRRPADMVARYGGEEFACILPDTAFEDALLIAQDLEHQVRQKKIPHDQSSVGPVMTISLGLATRIADAPGDGPALIGLADALLYRAKNTGRGRAVGAVLGSPDAQLAS